MKFVARAPASDEMNDFHAFRVEASISVGIDDLPPPFHDAVFVKAREGLGYWEFLDLDTDLGRVLIGQPQRRQFCATIWCERDLASDQIRQVCDGLFRTRVQVMNPETGKIW